MTEAFPSPHAVPPSLKQNSLLKQMSTRLDQVPAGGISVCQVFVPCLPLPSFLGLHRGVQLPQCPRKRCQEGGCQEQPRGSAGSQVSFDCTEFQGHPTRMGRGGQVPRVPGHRGLPRGCCMGMSSGRACGNGENVSLMEAGHQGGR